MREVKVLELGLLRDRRRELLHEVFHEIGDEDWVLDIGGVLLLGELVSHLLGEGGELDLLPLNPDSESLWEVLVGEGDPMVSERPPDGHLGRAGDTSLKRKPLEESANLIARRHTVIEG